MTEQIFVIDEHGQGSMRDFAEIFPGCSSVDDLPPSPLARTIELTPEQRRELYSCLADGGQGE